MIVFMAAAHVWRRLVRGEANGQHAGRVGSVDERAAIEQQVQPWDD